MAQSYNAEQLGAIEKAGENFSIHDEGNDNSAQFGDIALTATASCADKFDWNEDQIFDAMLFEVGRLGEGASRRSGGLTAEQLAKLDTALAKQDRSEMWATLERTVAAGVTGEEAETTSKEEVKLGLFVIAAGLGTDEKVGEKVGVLLGMMAVQRYARREFEAHGKKE